MQLSPHPCSLGCCPTLLFNILFNVGSVFLFVLVCITLRSSYFEEEERAGCFAFIVLRISCYCKCSVALPHNVVGWSGVYVCCIS